AAAKAYLASPGSGNGSGQAYLQNLAANASASLPIPPQRAPAGSANCKTDPSMTNDPGFCDFLPTGFSTASVNSYGQNFSIRVLKDGTAAGTPPSSYSFMIMTTGGDTIPDASCGRISSQIGGDGGF